MLTTIKGKLQENLLSLSVKFVSIIYNQLKQIQFSLKNFPAAILASSYVIRSSFIFFHVSALEKNPFYYPINVFVCVCMKNPAYIQSAKFY